MHLFIQSCVPVVMQINKSMDELRKACDRFAQREKNIDRELNSIMGELTAFQREKQSRLNTVQTVVPLRASQILAGLQPPQYRIDGALPPWASPSAPVGQLPPTIDHCVLFTRDKLRTLRSRIGELESETIQAERKFKDLHKDERALMNEKRKLENEIAEASKRAEDLQLLKFGRVVDVDALDRATNVSNAASMELHQSIATTAAAQDAELAAIKAKMAADQERLLELTRQHTRLLETVATLTARQAALEAQLSGKAQRATDTTSLATALGATQILVGDEAPEKPLQTVKSATSSVLDGLHSIKPLPGMHSVPHAGLPSTASLTNANAVKIGLINAAALHRSLASSANVRSAAAATARKGAVGLSTTLGGHSGIVVTDAAALMRGDAAERSKMIAVVKSQAAQIEQMRTELANLKRKGGVTYIGAGAPLTHSVTPKPRSPSPRSVQPTTSTSRLSLSHAAAT